MGSKWRERASVAKRIKEMRTIITATRRLGMKPPRAIVRYLAVLEKIKSWNRKEALAKGKLKRYLSMEKRYAKKLRQGGKEDGKE